MKIPQNPKLVIVKAQNWLSLKVKSRFLASILLLYIPLLAIGFVLQETLDYPVIALKGIQLSLLWLAIMPLLVQDSLLLINDFFITHSHLIKNTSIWFKVRDEYIAKLESRKFIVLEVIMSIALSLLVTTAIFYKALLLIQVWSFITYSILFFFGWTGVRGVLLMPNLIRILCRLKIKIDPLHPDCYGGLSSICRLLIRGTLYFSTKALVLPLAFEMLKIFSSMNKDMTYIIYFLTAGFIGLMIYSFIAPILILKKYVDKNKEKLLIESRQKLDDLYKESFNDENRKSFPVELYFYNELYYKKILNIKDHPYNAEILFELFVSVFLPVMIGILGIVRFN